MEIKYYNKSHSTKKIKVLYLHENSLRIINNYKVLNVLKKLKKDKVVKIQQKRVKRKSTTVTPTTAPKVRKYSENTANKLINQGSGIVLD